MRRIFILIIIILVLGGGAWYVYKKTHSAGAPSGTLLSKLFPNGNPATPSTPGTINNSQGTSSVTNSDQTGSSPEDLSTPFSRLTNAPIAGYTSFNANVTVVVPADPKDPKSKPTTKVVSKHFVRYVARNNGYVYELVDGELPLQITNVYIPNIYEAFFADNNQTAILRFLRDDQQTIASFSIPIPPENKDGTRTQKPGVYLPDNISAMTISPDSTQLARLVSSNNLTTLTITNTVNTKKTEVFSSLLKEWLVSWPTKNNIYLQTKASYSAPGYLYWVDQSARRLRRVLGSINGLTSSISPSGNYIIYSESINNSFTTKILNTKTNNIKDLHLALLPEKCTWLANDDLICAGNSVVPQNNYPDDWYMGTVHFSDQLYHVYTTSNIYDVLYDNNNKSFDMVNLSVDEKTSTLYFIDKPTGFLWQMTY